MPRPGYAQPPTTTPAARLNPADRRNDCRRNRGRTPINPSGEQHGVWSRAGARSSAVARHWPGWRPRL